ncbi:hypothetical protein HPB48_019292 [Haemaphysalis longicornis]|uniref:Uncharacterized protein n=1 Tax=Haemaphysalis longicornis TaxID=44386 RepID=A0A9J6GPC8_HAELO|nr:hypothetical protein HPB48_019292 [Haemaphysalis longicornis]
MQNLCFPDTDVLSARMMARSKTALLMLRGTYVTRFVPYYRAKYDCKPHKPKATILLHLLWHRPSRGHLATSRHIKCKACGTPDQEHACKLCCANCQGEHPEDDPTNPDRDQADSATSKAAYFMTAQVQKKDGKKPETSLQVAAEGEPFSKHDKSREPARECRNSTQAECRCSQQLGQAMAAVAAVAVRTCNNGNRRERSLSLRRKRRSVSRSALPTINHSMPKTHTMHANTPHPHGSGRVQTSFPRPKAKNC